MNLLNKYNKEFFPDMNVLNGNYNFQKTSGNTNVLNAERNRVKIIQHFFSAIKVLSSKPVFNITMNKVTISLFYYVGRENNQKLGLNNNTINNLGDLLSKLFNREVELRFVKLHYPYLNRNILAQYIGLNANNYNFRFIKNKIMRKRPISSVKNLNSENDLENQLPSHIIGMKIKFSGRLVTERVRPRKTVSTAKMGSFTRNNKSFIDYGSYTGKNARGAFTVKVWINQTIGKGPFLTN